jgi:hypothetical protein
LTLGPKFSCIAVLIATLIARDGVSRARQTGAPIVRDPEAFYAAVRDNLARSQGATIGFSYKERRTNIHTNPFGRLGTDGVELAQVYPSANPKLTYRRLLERDGVSLSKQELAQQDRDYLAKVAEVRRLEEHEDDRRRQTEDDAAARRRAQEMIEDVVAALQFTITGKSLHEGRPAVVVAFVGRPTFRPKNARRDNRSEVPGHCLGRSRSERGDAHRGQDDRRHVVRTWNRGPTQ